LTWTGGRMRTQRYLSLAFRPDDGPSPDEWAARIAGAMRESVAAHAAADVEVGCFLSAGVDSTLVAAEASRLMDARTFSIGYGEERFSELAAARATADALGLRNRSRTLGAREFFDSVGAVQYAMDEPLPNPSAIPLYHLCRMAAEEVKVVMSGEGADELFGGYPYYQECLAFEPYLRLPRPLRAAAGAVAEALPPFHGRRFLMRGRHGLPTRYLRNEYVFGFAECGDVLRAPADCPPPAWWTADVFAAGERAGAGVDEVTLMQWADLHVWLPCDILQKADKMSMAASLELRVPFLDRHVMDVALRLPTAERVTRDATKPALRRAAALTVPPDAAARPKIGFVTPLAQWLREEPWASRVREALTGPVAARFFNTDALARLVDDHVAGRAANMRRIWAAYCFVAWYEEFFVKR
ncbi:MAG: asparagine synthetase B, partial [Eggerthellaceae bacterium]|nr:asparagine synthetase B [Eggerthellaceae bacterium]